MLASRYGNCDIAVELVKSGAYLDLQNKVRGTSVFVFELLARVTALGLCVCLSVCLQLVWH